MIIPNFHRKMFWPMLLLSKNNMKRFDICYQGNCRIYLDEYPEQEELRKEWLEKNKFTFKKLQEMIKNLGIYDEYTKLLLHFVPEKLIEPNPYQHFIDRFNKRN